MATACSENTTATTTAPTTTSSTYQASESVPSSSR